MVIREFFQSSIDEAPFKKYKVGLVVDDQKYWLWEKLALIFFLVSAMWDLLKGMDSYVYDVFAENIFSASWNICNGRLFYKSKVGRFWFWGGKIFVMLRLFIGWVCFLLQKQKWDFNFFLKNWRMIVWKRVREGTIALVPNMPIP